MNGSSDVATEVEIRACMDLEEDDGKIEVVPTTIDRADYFGVYIGQPGDFHWAADFAHHTDAYNWAEEVADLHDLKLQDRCDTEH